MCSDSFGSIFPQSKSTANTNCAQDENGDDLRPPFDPPPPISDYLLDGLILKISVLVPYNTTDPERAQYVPFRDEERKRVEAGLDQRFPDLPIHGSHFSAKRWKPDQTHRWSRSSLWRTDTGIKVEFYLHFSPLRHLRNILFPGSTERDFKRRTNLLPFHAANFETHRARELSWVHARISEFIGNLGAEFLNIKIATIRFVHTEVVWDYRTSLPARDFERFRQAVHSLTSDYTEKSSDTLYCKGRIENAQLGAYWKCSDRIRTQLTADVRETDEGHANEYLQSHLWHQVPTVEHLDGFFSGFMQSYSNVLARFFQLIENYDPADFKISFQDLLTLFTRIQGVSDGAAIGIVTQLYNLHHVKFSGCFPGAASARRALKHAGIAFVLDEAAGVYGIDIPLLLQTKSYVVLIDLRVEIRCCVETKPRKPENFPRGG